MGKFTKAQRNQIESAIQSINRSLSFINREDITIARKTEINHLTEQGPSEYRARSTHRTQHYKGRDNQEWDIGWIEQLSPLDKGIGSDLVALYTAKSILERLLENK